MKILAATDFSTRSEKAVRRAARIAADKAAKLTVLHVVDDDQPQSLIENGSRGAQRVLAEQLHDLLENRQLEARPLVTSGDPFNAILKAADDEQADLIVMGVHRRQLLRDIFIGTTVERVIRSGPRPVLMVNCEVQGPYRTVVAPVDMSAPSANALEAARTFALTDEAHVTALHAFVALAKGMNPVAGIERARIDEYVAGERQKAVDALASFMASRGFEGERWSQKVEEGGAFDVILRVFQSTRPDLLVMGTRGRSGLPKLLIGSVTEQVLRSVDVDVLAVPPAGRDSALAPIDWARSGNWLGGVP